MCVICATPAYPSVGRRPSGKVEQRVLGLSSRRRCFSFASLTGRRMSSAITALLFWLLKVLSNAALTSSGTLKLTVAMEIPIVEILNNVEDSLSGAE